MPEILKQLDALNTDQFFCPEHTYADPMIGACLDGEDHNANVYGPFSEEMKSECEAFGLGSACRAMIQLWGR